MGMRFVSVHMRFVGSKGARSVCADAHVCELLLVPTEIGRLQAQVPSKAYRNWRRVRPTFEGLGRLAQSIVLYGVRCDAGAESDTRVDKNNSTAAQSTATTQRGLPASPSEAANSDKNDPPSSSLAFSHPGFLAGGAAHPSEPAEPASSFVVVRASSRSHLQGTAGGERRMSALSVGFGSWTRDVRGGMTSWGASVSKEMVELLQMMCRMSSLGISEVLDEKWSIVKDNGGLDESGLGSIYFSSFPISAAYRRWQFRMSWTAVGLYCVYTGIQAFVSYTAHTSGYAAGPYQYYRLETMLTRDGREGRDILRPAVSDFGVIGSSGCTPNASFVFGGKQVPEQHLSGPVGSSFVVKYPEPRSMKGWYLATGQGPASQDPAFFNVWATNGEPNLEDPECESQRHQGVWWEGGDEEDWCGVRWDRVGTPRWRFVLDAGFWGPRHGEIVLVQVPVTLPLSRNTLETFLLQPPWYLFHFHLVFSPLIWGFSILLSVIAALRRSLTLFSLASHEILAFGLCTLVFSNGIGCAIALSSNVAHVGVEHLLRMVSLCVFLYAVVRQGPRFFYNLAIYTALDTVVYAGIIYWYHRDVFAAPPAQTGSTGFMMVILILALRAKELRESKRLIKEDQIKYDALWESQCQQEDSRAGIEHLAKVVDMIGLQKTDYCRQHNRARADQLSTPLRERYLRQAAVSDPTNPLFWDLGQWYVPGRPSKTSEVSSLMQLYCTASIANLILIKRLQEWAYLSQGLFQVEGGTEPFVKWRDLKDGRAVVDRVMWTGLKRRNRSMEKLLRSYKNALGRLLDISRNLIVFETMSDLTMALGIIVTDENVRVERIKNRLSPDYRSEETGGYRDVCINLRVVNKDAFALGAELHMCEVQLILLDFANLRSSEGHKRYVRARNLGGS
eukprot:CAMPEP_0173419262 /NCGR_PEP_ID=MMETSP1357-20121228/1178_1 /TAXON_ID=77926 /ORGANISM="Hemiselmis rufescens, Strain PCC563" /LENGTH=899 /DNA_ID=CAMNT_0014381885 /DNA_START=11 /DNA_END=2710 /DNA_ORIENTATION=-